MTTVWTTAAGRLLADSSSKVGMLVDGALIRLFWAGVTADLEFDYVDDVRITKFLIYSCTSSFSIVACLAVIRILSPFSCE